MSLPIERQTFLVVVDASIMPPLAAHQIEEAVARLAYEQESQRGMGYLAVHVEETTGLAELMAWPA